MTNMPIRRWWLFTPLVAILLGLAIIAIRDAQRLSLRMSCGNNLRQLCLSLLNYHDAYGRLPLASETKPDIGPWRSWRSHVYPTFIEQSSPLYDASVAWNAAPNRRLLDGTPIPRQTKMGETYLRVLDRIPPCFACPACQDDIGVNYVVVTGAGTAFPNSRSVSMQDITDGPENTLLVVESVNCNPNWTEPRDLDIATMSFQINSSDQPSISSYHTGGANVCFADGKCGLLTTKITASELTALLTISGGEPVTRADLQARGIWIPH